MALHDFRRAMATFLAMEFPEKIGLIPGVLQHLSPEVNERHYNLSRSVQAGRRFAAAATATQGQAHGERQDRHANCSHFGSPREYFDFLRRRSNFRAAPTPEQAYSLGP